MQKPEPLPEDGGWNSLLNDLLVDTSQQKAIDAIDEALSEHLKNVTIPGPPN